MSEKKGFFASLFGGNKSGGCCNMEIVEEPKKKGGCCDMEIIPEETGCDCGGACCGEPAGTETDQADILILGPGCKNCQGLEQNVRQAHEFLFPDKEYEPTEILTQISSDISYLTGIYPETSESGEE